MRRPHRFMLGGALLGGSLVVALVAYSQVGQATRSASASKQPAGGAGLVAVINEETGELGAPAPQALTPEEMNAFSTDAEDLVEVQMPDGSFMIDLQGRFQSAVLATLDAQGRPVISCVDNPIDARAVLGTRVASTSTLEEK